MITLHKLICLACCMDVSSHVSLISLYQKRPDREKLKVPVKLKVTIPFLLEILQRLLQLTNVTDFLCKIHVPS